MENNWILRWETIHPFYRIEASMIMHKKRTVLGSNYDKLMAVSKNNVVQMYYSKKDLERISKQSLKLFNNKEQIKRYVKNTNKDCINLSKYIKKTTKDLDKLHNKQLSEAYKKIVMNIGKLHCSYDLSRPEYFESIHKKIVDYLISKKIKKENINNILGILTTSSKQNLLEKEEKEWLEIILKAKTAKENVIIDMIKKHTKKFGWIGSSEQKAWDVEYYQRLFKRDKKLSKEEIIKKINSKKQYKKIILKKQKEINRQLKISKNIEHFVNTIKYFRDLRLDIRLKWVESSFLLNQIFEEISKRSRVNKGLLENYKIEEIQNLLKNNKKIDLSEIKKRNIYLFKLLGNKLDLYTENKAKNIEKKEIEQIDYSKVRLLIGRVANPGLVIGKVKIINSLSKDQEKEIQKMKPGDILVTGMTRPHLIQAIKKAAAIITDEGGIASHAAIISREFNIPCIMATKIATKVLKDGDIVEVDANKGIIKIKQQQKDYKKLNINS